MVYEYWNNYRRFDIDKTRVHMAMTPYKISIAFGVLLFFTACKKHNSTHTGKTDLTYDTIKPLSYFPAYPGSYWKYIDSNNDTIVYKTDSIYKKDYYVIGAAAFVSDTFYVPFYDGFPIWGYEAHTGPISNSGSYPLSRILSDTLPVGSDWPILHWSGTEVNRKIIAKDTTVIVGGISYYPTIVVEEYYSSGPPVYTWIAKRYYTKDIGLVKEDINNPNSNTVNSRQLVEYFINH